MRGFIRLAMAYENRGKPVSVCDSCEMTYPEEWVALLEGICPFCGQAHTEDVCQAADCVNVATGEVKPFIYS